MKQLVIVILLLAAPLALLFRQQLFHHNFTGFSNDGPLGTIHAKQAALPESITGVWEDLNFIGKQDPAIQNASAGLRIACENAALTVVLLMPLLFVALRWGMIWSVIVMNAAFGICAMIFLVSCWTGMIDPYNTSGWILFPVGELMFIPSAIIVLYHDTDRTDNPMDWCPSWKDTKEMPGWCWLFLAFLLSIDGIPYLIKNLK